MTSEHHLTESGLPLRRLGRTDARVTVLGLGGAGLGNLHGEITDDQAIATVHRAIELGITLIDTAPYYLESERRLGLALAGGLRERVFLSTKTGRYPDRAGEYTADETYWSVERSLKRLRTDRIDLLLIHDCNAAQFDRCLAPDGALAALQRLRDQGVIRFIGLGQRDHDLHLRAIHSGEFDAILTFADLNPIRQTARHRVIPAAAHCDVGVINGSPLYLGLLAGDPAVTDRGYPAEDVERARRYWQWCRATGHDPIHVAMQFSLREPGVHVTLSGAKSPEEIADCVEAARRPLPIGTWRALYEALGVV